MVSFQRMKEDFDDISSQVTAKLPGKTVVWLTFLVFLFIILIIGFGIGFGAAKNKYSCSGSNSKDCSVGEIPVYYFLSNNSASCPALEAEGLVTSLPEGQSFEGLSVMLQCRGNHNPYPLSVKCQRKTTISGQTELEWSALPVCYPAVLVKRSVSCTGNPQQTNCRLQCIQNYVAVETSSYSCFTQPCRAWSTEGKQCYLCDQNCTQFARYNDPSASDLLSHMSCDPDCQEIVVTSDGLAAVWQNKRTGLFRFMGEHNGRPVYQNNATKEYLYYTYTGAEWLVGPDFRKPHAGIQVFQNDDKTCPERHGGENNTKLYIDSSQPTPLGGSMWQNDTTISFQCYSPGYMKVAKCDCTTYKMYYTLYTNDTVPEQVEYFSGIFQKVENPDETFGLLAPLYSNTEKDLFLFSHHPGGKVWQISQKLTTTPMRAVFPTSQACPDQDDSVVWEWYNSTTPLGQQIYVPDHHIKMKCISHSHGA